MIVTPRLALRPIARSDEADFVAMCTPAMFPDPLIPWESFDPRQWLDGKLGPEAVEFCYAVRHDDRLVGIVQCVVMKGEPYHYLSFGYFFAETAWGKGIATEACKAAIEHRGAGKRPMYAQPHKDNAASIRVLEKCGFQRIDNVPDPAMPDRVWFSFS